jgi:hypothetical protein
VASHHQRAMRLPELTKPQWDAALDAARALMNGDADCATDRAAFRNAKARLADLLPAETDAREIIRAAVRWDMMNGLAASLAMVPGATVERAL